jgi:hypothetical protein
MREIGFRGGEDRLNQREDGDRQWRGNAAIQAVNRRFSLQ